MKLKKKYYILSLALIFIASLLIGLLFNKKCSKDDSAICKLDFKGSTLLVKVAYTKKSQAKGLMGVTRLKDNEGMIFIYDDPSYLSFWMKNTLIPLSIAFIDADGKIIDVYDMKVEGNKLDHEFPVYQSTSMVKYAVEAPLGWFTLNGITKYDRITIPETLK